MSSSQVLIVLAALLICIAKQSDACYGATLLRTGGLTCYEKRQIVDLHNRLRQAVAIGKVPGQSPATNMLEMAWDEELAQQAQNWANRCSFQHDSNSARRVSRFSVGQNLATTWTWPHPTAIGHQPDFDTQIKLWFNEVYQYTGSFSHSTGHYTQMIWSDTYLIGCGYSYYLQGTRYTKLYVCNYGPGGNVRGSKPYRRGSPSCTLYGTSPSPEYYGLCKVQGLFTDPCSYYG
ncbi:SCP [Nesidiocoris tenuis]|uniref:SCP n=1 Tax=Nesidiocoris tenuis TaxID=355587 RepID=A0ABN7B0P4_9HEMI|nr:SCP [Nesidiocoris tenuis]